LSIYSGMTVQQFIDTLEHEVAEEDRDNAILEFYTKENGEEIDLDIKSMSGFSISPGIMIELEKVKKSLIAPANFKHSFVNNQSKTWNELSSEVKTKLNELIEREE